MSNRDAESVQEEECTTHECWSCGEEYEEWDAAANCCGMGVAIYD